MVDYRRNNEEIQFSFGPEPTGGNGNRGSNQPTNGGGDGNKTNIRINVDNLTNLIITSAISAGVGAVLFGGHRNG